ncbi:4'-phosphopantetheinyl transferase superfamily protein [Massilia sp. CT11-137]|uniref:4'-phosphopantetheinyl transferase superfamily protein n=1 Tax=Massilia sp. CT11-137 TaxID=3393901 RepID=UPI0039AED64F
MAPTNHYLVSGSAPLVGRAFEAAAHQARADDTGTAAPRQPAPVLPFVDRILDYQAGASITVARRLALDTDLFLADHNFVHAPGVKPLRECYPVVPMTGSLELMAEAAACLTPGYGLLGFENVTARRWIAVSDNGELELTVKGQVEHGHEHADYKRIAVEVLAGPAHESMIASTVLLGTRYSAPPPAQSILPPTGTTVDAGQLYADRHLFHGPRFQCLHGPLHIGPDGLHGQLRVRPTQDWFTFSDQPQLLCDPGLLDTIGQLIAVWSMQDGSSAFPVGLGRLDFHGPTPAAGSILPVTIRITGRQLKMISADVEIGDGAGGAWLRVAGWRSWQFKWAPELVALQRHPSRCLLSETRSLAGPDRDIGYQWLAAQTIAGFDLALLARHYLRAEEMIEFDAKAHYPQRQLEWLLGRVAAKDAARAWSARTANADLDLHPATFAIRNDPHGQPVVASWPAPTPVPRISIAHSHGVAVAIAAGAPVGIDIERVAEHDAHWLASFTTEGERRQLAAYGAPERAAWITRLWCAKEAFGKRLGLGLHRPARDVEACAWADDHSLRMRHVPDGACADVRTLRDGDFIVAIDSPVHTHDNKEQS